MRLLNEMRDVGGGRGNLYPFPSIYQTRRRRRARRGRIRTELSADGFRRHRHLRRREHLSIYLSVRPSVRRARVRVCRFVHGGAPFSKRWKGGVDLTVCESSATNLRWYRWSNVRVNDG